MIALVVLGFSAMLVCLFLQAITSMACTNYFARISGRPLGPRPWRTIGIQFSTLMSVLMAGTLIQLGVWAAIYRLLGAFDDFETALYFSGVTFTSLGYGDVLMTGRARMLAPLEAATGLMMFGITTALLIAVVQRSIEKWGAEQ